MKKFCLILHRWLGIVFGIFISIMCFTGAILVFRSEIATLFGYESFRDMEFLNVVMRLHRWLMMSPDNPHGGTSVGRVLMGISTICCTLILITGVVAWWPKDKSKIKKHFSVSFTKGWGRFVHDSHVSLGIYVTIFLLLMSLTGPVWSFGWYRKGAVAVIGGKEAPRGERKAQPEAKEMPMPAVQNGNIAEKGERAHKDENHASKNIDERAKSHKKEGKDESIAQNRGEKAQESVKSDKKAGQKGGNSPQRTFIQLHTGTWGGMTTRVIYCIAAIIGGFLPISGYWLWWKKRRRKKENKHKEE